MTMQERLSAATALLTELAVGGVHACICGGYARDTICDKPIRDVDLYVDSGDYDKVCALLFGQVAVPVENDDTPEYRHQSITMQCEYDLSPDKVIGFGLPTGTINLIGLHDVRPQFSDIVGKFNLGICKAGIDVLRGLQVTDDFRADYKDKQITLLRTSWGHEATLKQFIKLQRKYPWPLRVPQTEDDFDVL